MYSILGMRIESSSYKEWAKGGPKAPQGEPRQTRKGVSWGLTSPLFFVSFFFPRHGLRELYRGERVHGTLGPAFVRERFLVATAFLPSLFFSVHISGLYTKYGGSFVCERVCAFQKLLFTFISSAIASASAKEFSLTHTLILSPSLSP